jgi:hypothetical protein
MKFDDIGNGIYVGEMRGARFAKALADFAGEHPELRITAVTQTRFEILGNLNVPIEFVLITEPKAQPSK